MKSVIELLVELAGGVVLLFATGWMFARISGYSEHYNEMLYDEESDEYITIKKNNDHDEDDIIHHVSI